MRRAIPALAATLTACTLLTDLDGFVSTRAADAQAEEAGTTTDARARTDAQVQLEGGPPVASPGDGGDASPPAAGGCSTSLLAGNNVLQGSTVDGIPKDVIDTYGYNVASAGRAECVWVYVESSEGSLALGVYATEANGEHAGKLVGRAVIEAPKVGWNSAKLDKAFDVQKGKRFWIGLSPLTMGGVENRVHVGSCGELHLHAAGSGSTGTPDPYPSDTTDYTDACDALMYLAPAE